MLIISSVELVKKTVGYCWDFFDLLPLRSIDRESKMLPRIILPTSQDKSYDKICDILKVTLFCICIKKITCANNV